MPKVSDQIRSPLCAALALAATMMVAEAKGQDAEPRSYSNTPVGLNFLIAGYAYSQGKMAFDPTLAVADAQFQAHTGALAYVRSFDLFGQSAKLDLIAPYSTFSAHGLVAGLPQEREMNGFGDPRFRVSVNLFGAPALSSKEFAKYKQDLIVGVSLQVSAPSGQYDDSKLLNLGTNRWSFRPELGISKACGKWTLEIAPSITFFTDNPDFFNGNRFAQAPLYLVRGSVIRNFDSGAWISLDGTYFKGTRTTLNSVPSDNEQENVRAGFTVALPINRQNSIKLNASTGIYTRTGSEFTVLSDWRGNIVGVKGIRLPLWFGIVLLSIAGCAAARRLPIARFGTGNVRGRPRSGERADIAACLRWVNRVMYGRPLSAKAFFVFWQVEVMHTASNCGHLPRALMEIADRIPIILACCEA